jgi:hypothetical protein
VKPLDPIRLPWCPATGDGHAQHRVEIPRWGISIQVTSRSCCPDLETMKIPSRSTLGAPGRLTPRCRDQPSRWRMPVRRAAESLPAGRLGSRALMTPRGDELIAQSSVLGEVELATCQPQVQVVGVINFRFVPAKAVGHPGGCEQPAHGPQHQREEPHPERPIKPIRPPPTARTTCHRTSRPPPPVPSFTSMPRLDCTHNDWADLAKKIRKPGTRTTIAGFPGWTNSDSERMGS